MSLTRSIKETARTRIARDPAFRKALLREGNETIRDGLPEVGQTIFRDYFAAGDDSSVAGDKESAGRWRSHMRGNEC